MPSSRPTINDVARRAFVSKTTVSHVINNTRFVDPATRQRVLAAVAELDYRPSNIARSLTTHRTGTVGMIVADASNYFFAELARGAEDGLRSGDYALIMCSTDEDLEREVHYFDMLLSQRVEGIVAATTSQKWAALSQAEAHHTPIVFVDRMVDGLDGPYVGTDNENGGYQAARHFLEMGHRQIGIVVGTPRLPPLSARLKGFSRALSEWGVSLPPEWVVSCEVDVESSRAAARALLARPHRPAALFAVNNLLTLGALLAARDLGLRCPEDIGLLGFDDHPWAAVCAPPLSMVRQPAREIGYTAANILRGLIEGQPPTHPVTTVSCELIVRQSCCVQHAAP
jgi:LacI family transcriptional regulator